MAKDMRRSSKVLLGFTPEATKFNTCVFSIQGRSGVHYPQLGGD